MISELVPLFLCLLVIRIYAVNCLFTFLLFYSLLDCRSCLFVIMDINLLPYIRQMRV